MASSTSAYSDETEVLETHNCKSKDPTIIQSKITVISEKKEGQSFYKIFSATRTECFFGHEDSRGIF